MKHPNKSGRGKHFTKGKYVNIVKNIDEQSKNIKIRRTSRARVRIYKYDGKAYKISCIKQKEQGFIPALLCY